MSELDCMEKIWGCCDSSISTSKFYDFSAKTEEHFEEIEQEIADIEASGLTYEEGDYIKIDGNVISVSGINPSDYALKSELNGKQDTLVSGENIKTINGTSILGSGNIEIQGGSVVIDQGLDSGSTNAVANSAITNAINTISGNTDNKQDKLTEGAFIDIDTNNVISAKIQVLSKAEWEALVDKDPNIIYLIKED